MNDIKVSVLCLVYNHEKYLRQCLDSFVNQKTNFRYEVLVHDDCSTDDSKKIINEYYEKYPEIIVPIFEQENQYSKDVKIVKDILTPKVNGKYFTFCEGDDYWKDNNLLQKKYDFMEKNLEYSLCTNNALIINNHNMKIGTVSPVKNKDNDLTCEEIIEGGGAYIATNSIFSRTEYLYNLPEYFKDFSIDYFWQIYLSSIGNTYCFKDYMTVYRFGSEGSWTKRIGKNIEKKIEIDNKIAKGLDIFDNITEGKYHESVEKRKLSDKCDQISLSENYNEFKLEPYKSYIKTLSKKQRLKYYLKIHFPRFFRFCKYIKSKYTGV